ncbi:YycH family regulatory protein [Salinibacillus xinjiangensis]|uniref:Regulatory protein YycH domain-containing protein n=1 Tax=Salinibacillus xinjiangensis TaxID=1229268 RepID=A0A6G1XAL1_9BACI|nr:two-component system activity regulator YycH [Salinibacillus xinjiangensis]MRG87977.1 hypothetical protein [Salinibacillus xinjiangensis]
MNIENIKSAILAVLVLISLLLTIGIWNYSSANYQTNESDTLNISINGEKAELNEAVLPTQMVFHQEGHPLQFTDKTKEGEFYQALKEWDFRIYEDKTNVNINEEQTYVELIYPENIPVSLLPRMFNIGEDGLNADWDFNRLYLVLNNESNTIDVVFQSTVHERVMRTEVRETEAFQQVRQYMQSDDSFVHLLRYEVNNQVFYLPEEKLKLANQTYTTNNIPLEPIIHNLFQDPENVREYRGRYSDGYRLLEKHQVYSNQYYMKYKNPISGEFLEREELISQSLTFVNNHDGWTDDYMLFDILEGNSSIQYQMLFNGYPVMSRLGQIEQKWLDRELDTYVRPLIRLSTPLSQEHNTVRSGSEIIQILETEPRRFPEKSIEDIQIMYTMNEKQGYSSDIISLEPQWFIKYNGTWAPIPTEDSLIESQGGV